MTEEYVKHLKNSSDIDISNDLIGQDQKEHLDLIQFRHLRKRMFIDTTYYYL